MNGGIRRGEGRVKGDRRSCPTEEMTDLAVNENSQRSCCGERVGILGRDILLMINRSDAEIAANVKEFCFCTAHCNTQGIPALRTRLAG